MDVRIDWRRKRNAIVGRVQQGRPCQCIVEMMQNIRQGHLSRPTINNMYVRLETDFLAEQQVFRYSQLDGLITQDGLPLLKARDLAEIFAQSD